MATAQNLGKMVDEIYHEIDTEIDIPNFVLPDPSMVSYYLLERERKLILGESVEAYSDDIWEHIVRWNIEDRGKPVEERQPIVVYVMSYGGSVDDMWMIIDMIRSSETPVWTVNLGVAHSAAALVFLAGDRRLMMPNAHVMLHEGSAALRGDANKVLDAAENYSKDLKRMQNFVLERTKITPKLLQRHRKDDWYLDAETCLRYGVCEKIIESIGEII